MSEQLAVLLASAKSEPSSPSPPASFAEAKESSPDLGKAPAGDAFLPYKSIRPEAGANLTAAQAAHLEALIGRFTTKTAASKARTQRYRKVLADNRASAGFRFSIKEMLYPIQATRSAGPWRYSARHSWLELSGRAVRQRA